MCQAKVHEVKNGVKQKEEKIKVEKLDNRVMQMVLAGVSAAERTKKKKKGNSVGEEFK